jgi:hypothetical protein
MDESSVTVGSLPCPPFQPGTKPLGSTTALLSLDTDSVPSGKPPNNLLSAPSGSPQLGKQTSDSTEGKTATSSTYSRSVGAGAQTTMGKSTASTASTAPVIVNELLCFLMYRYAHVPATQLKTVIANYYSDEEIVTAMETLYSNIESLQTNLLPRILRRKGGQKAKLTTDDIFNMMALADENNILSRLPTFAAVNLDRIPTVKPEDVDLYTLTSKLQKLENRLLKCESFSDSLVSQNDKLVSIEIKFAELENSVTSKLKTINTCEVKNPPARPDMECTTESCEPMIQPQDSDSQTVNTAHLVQPQGRYNNNQVLTTAWADKVKQPVTLPNGEDGFTTVLSRKPKHTNRQVQRSNTNRTSFLGTKTVASNGPVKSGVNITHKAILHIDNLDNECSAESLTKFVEELNVKVISCFPSKSWLKDEARDFVRAFRLCIDAKDKAILCSPTYWPSGVVIRDWVFTQNNHNGGAH